MSRVFPEAKVFAAEDLRVGLRAEFEREIVEADIRTFAANSGGANPLHVDSAYAETTAYGARLVHGAFQVGLASALIGMHLPGRQALLANLSARFPAPLYFPCRVRVRGEIAAWDAATRSGQLKVSVLEVSHQTPTAEIAMGFTFHEAAQRVEPAANPQRAPAARRGKRVVLVTGASGGLGSALVEALAAEY